MKCVVLAGGSGDTLWPISRKNYPKQFIEIRKGRSMFQEAILRNIPFCDEFVIVTNVAYENIARNQLSVFQGLNYSFVLEPVPFKTAASFVYVALHSDPDEDILMVSVDQIIEGDYNKWIIEAKKRIIENKIFALCIEPTNKKDGYHFLNRKQDGVEFNTKYSDSALWDCGIFIAKASAIINATRPDYIEKIKQVTLKNMLLNSKIEKEIAFKISDILDCNKFEIITCDFKWNRLFDLSDFYNVVENNNNCIDVGMNNEIINQNNNQLVVVNGLNDIIVANTKDAIYISSKKEEQQNKQIARLFEEKKHYFESRLVSNETWGIIERVDKTEHTKINKLTIFPGADFQVPFKSGRAYNYIVSSGELIIEIKNNRYCYKKNQSFSINANLKDARFKNMTSKNIRVIQIIDHLEEENIVSDDSCFVRLHPIYKDFIWGGTKMKDLLNKDASGFDTVAES